MTRACLEEGNKRKNGSAKKKGPFYAVKVLDRKQG